MCGRVCDTLNRRWTSFIRHAMTNIPRRRLMDLSHRKPRLHGKPYSRMQARLNEAEAMKPFKIHAPGYGRRAYPVGREGRHSTRAPRAGASLFRAERPRHRQASCTGHRERPEQHAAICPSLPSRFLCLPFVVASTTTRTNSPFPVNHLAIPPLPDAAFTCCRQLHSLRNYSPPRCLHLVFCRDAALCTGSCLRLPQPGCTSQLPLLTQHLLRDCSPAIRPRKLSAYSSSHLHLCIVSSELSRRYARDCLVLESARRGHEQTLCHSFNTTPQIVSRRIAHMAPGFGSSTACWAALLLCLHCAQAFYIPGKTRASRLAVCNMWALS